MVSINFKFKKKQLYFLTFVSLLSINLIAQTVVTPKLLSRQESSQLIEEIIHPLSVQKYEQSWLLPALDIDDRSKPELVVASFIAALKKGQYERAMDFWDAASKTLIIASDKADGKTKKDWLVEWDKKYKGQNFSIRERISYGRKYVLIPYYRQISDTPNQSVLVETLSLRQDGDTWLLTLDLAKTPVPSNWMKAGERVKRVSDILYK